MERIQVMLQCRRDWEERDSSRGKMIKLYEYINSVSCWKVDQRGTRYGTLWRSKGWSFITQHNTTKELL